MREQKKYYKEISKNFDISEIEQEIISFWKTNSSFQKSIANRPKSINNKNNEFVFYDGPPFANGLPHYGHLLTGYIKDVFARYQTMKGKFVERRFGWDCHGLPAEMGVEKELKISGRLQITKYGIDNFNKKCQSSVMQFANDWEKYVDRQARWVDFKNDYKTMDKDYMESVIWAFKNLYDKGLVYESMRVMPYSWACETPLSNFETRLDNSYRQKASKAVTVAFTLNKSKVDFVDNTEFQAIKLLAWTTTPWTLPSNLALAVGKDITYSCIRKNNECLVIASSSVKSFEKELLNDENIVDIFKEVKGSKIVGSCYEPIFSYFKNHKNAFQVLDADFVEEGGGTGVVHIAPGFGEDDQKLCIENNIEILCPVDSSGKFTSEVSDFASMQVFEANDDIIKYLKLNQKWIKTEQYVHNYPHCWRTDTPLIYKAVSSWYIKVTSFKDRMVELNKDINWIPSHIRDGQFGKWLENARDWSISRNRFWGVPIPIWKSNNPNNHKNYVFGSIEEMEKFFNVKIDDLHRPFIDQLTAPDPEDPKYTLTRIEDVLDCWFESGSMPYAQVHYPFENKEWFENHFPADFIVEYIAQTRGWFYTLMVLSTALFDRIPFKNCICHGVVLDTEGKKLSKRLNNYADPLEIFDKYGSDAMRWLMMSSTVMNAGELLIDKEGNMVRDFIRLVIKPLWNSYSFFVMYANADGIKADYSLSYERIMDRYILSKCKITIDQIDSSLNSYDSCSACQVAENFISILNNWYIRRNKERFWSKENDLDKKQAYDCLYTILNLFCRTISPLLPLITDKIWQGITNSGTSIHLEDFPLLEDFIPEKKLMDDMDIVRDICNISLSIRNSSNIRIRQPLSSITIIGVSENRILDYIDLIKSELNVKEVLFNDDVQSFADYKLNINFPLLGKRLPHKIKEIIPAAKQGKWKALQDNKISISGEILDSQECELLLDPKNKDNCQSLSSKEGIVMLDVNLNEELITEGLARDLVRLIQQSRKDADLEITANLLLSIESDNKKIELAIKQFEGYIKEQTLSNSVEYNSSSNYDYVFEYKIEGSELKIMFSVTK